MPVKPSGRRSQGVAVVGGCVPRAGCSQPPGRQIDPGRAEMAATKSAWLK